LFNLSSIRTPARVACVVGLLLGITVGTLLVSNALGERWARTWLAIRSQAASTVDPAPALTVQGPPRETARLRQQLDISRARKAYHAALTIFFFSRYNTTLTLIPAASILAAAMLLFITKDGWGGVSRYVRATFAVSTAIAAFAGAFTKIFNQEANAAKNASLYISYDNLENRILSYLASDPPRRKGTASTRTAFIASIDSSLASLNDLAIGFDQNAIPDFQAAFQNAGLPAGTK